MSIKGFFKKIGFSVFCGVVAGISFASHAGYERYTSDLISKPVFNCVDVIPDEEFVNFESAPVRPLALSKNGELLFVANAPANCLEIYSTKGKKPKRISAVQVGLEPVAVAVKNNREVWVVNHLSDSISIVDISNVPHVKRTLQVGDEPRDIVFAGKNNKRAFITTAHRGQDNPNFEFEDLKTPGIGRADIWVYESGRVGEGLSGEPISILQLFTDTPRALAVSADKKTVYAAGFLTPNQTTVIDLRQVDNKQPAPNVNTHGNKSPKTPLIVKFNGSAWVDGSGKDWTDMVMLNLPDKDVFAIDAEATPPTLVREYAQVGTVLFNMAVNPATNSLYVTNTEARNEVRFEGHGIGNTSVRGHYVENRITVIKGGEVIPVHLNPHVDFSLPTNKAIPASEKVKSIAQPMEMQITRDGGTAYVAGFGSNKIAVIPTEQLEDGNYTPNAKKQIAVPRGPAGIVLSENGKRLYVYSRYENVLSVIKTRKKKVISTVELYNPEPGHVKEGRPFLYDAQYTSSNGTVSCGSCHVFGDLDALAWDLGDPDGEIVPHVLQEANFNPIPMNYFFQPMKGPMLTQTLRGIADSGPLHWRGDKTGSNRVLIDGQLESVEEAAFKEFNGAFVSLLGREKMLDEAELQAYTDFAMTIQMPPNPIRHLDNSLTKNQASGEDIYFNFPSDFQTETCVGCHNLNPADKVFGSGKMFGGNHPDFGQDSKVPQFRNIYQRVGMFGGTNNAEYFGDQIRGFGHRRDGTLATALDFIFNGAFFFDDDKQGFDVGDFLMVYPSNHMPIVGQQVTLSGRSGAQDKARLQLLVGQAQSGRCDLEANGKVLGRKYHAELNGDEFISDDFPPMPASWEAKGPILKRAVVTFTCKPFLY